MRANSPFVSLLLATYIHPLKCQPYLLCPPHKFIPNFTPAFIWRWLHIYLALDNHEIGTTLHYCPHAHTPTSIYFYSKGSPHQQQFWPSFITIIWYVCKPLYEKGILYSYCPQSKYILGAILRICSTSKNSYIYSIHTIFARMHSALIQNALWDSLAQNHDTSSKCWMTLKSYLLRYVLKRVFCCVCVVSLLIPKPANKQTNKQGCRSLYSSSIVIFINPPGYHTFRCWLRFADTSSP